MCGIVGVCDLGGARPVEESTLRSMLGTIRHRGPDQFGIYLDDHVGLGNARLSIIDLSTGQQPISNEDESLWIVFNGEVFNHPELRLELESPRAPRSRPPATPRSSCTRTRSTARTACPASTASSRSPSGTAGTAPCSWPATGWASAPSSTRRRTAPWSSAPRSRRSSPHPGVTASPDPVALDQIFTFWSTLSPRTFFRGIVELPPGHSMLVRDGRITLERYWEMAFPEDGAAPQRPTREYAEELRDLLIDAARIRLRADVPVGAYLSGGLDSSTITAIVRSQTTNPLETFSIAFTDAHYDESGFQIAMAEALGTEHHVVHATHADIGAVFPEVVWHAETPLMRTAPAPMFLLSGLVRDNRFKVVLSGEGADELLAGYDIFREAKIRRFWAEQPDSEARPALFKRIYPWMPAVERVGLRQGVLRPGAHGHRRPGLLAQPPMAHHGQGQAVLQRGDATRPPRPATATLTPSYPDAFDRWGPLQQAQYLETTILLSQYLLSSQGDRMAMAHSVEGRFPFLDHRVVEFANQLPPSLKLNGLTEKYLLKEVSREWLPAADQRPAQAALPGADPSRLLQRRRAGLRRGAALQVRHRAVRLLQPERGGPARRQARAGPPAGRDGRHGAGRHHLDPAGRPAVHIQFQTDPSLSTTPTT